MSDTLYIQTNENMEVHHPHVYLQDIVKLSCSNSKILNRLSRTACSQPWIPNALGDMFCQPWI